MVAAKESPSPAMEKAADNNQISEKIKPPALVTNKVPPDGKWGWMIVLAYAVGNMIIVPVMQSFGLIYKDSLADMGISATDASVILNTFSAFGMSFGLINGPLIRHFGYRKIGVAAGIIFAFGLFLTTWANSFTYFMITFSTIAATGMGMVTSAFSFAINSYFRKKRNRAIGLASTITGLGPIFIPLLISVLLEHYGTKGCVLILSAISLHISAAGLLLQPIKWHLVDGPPVTPITTPPREEVLDMEMQPLTTTVIHEEGEDDETSKGKGVILSIAEDRTNGGGGFSDFSSEDEADYLESNIRRKLSIEHDMELQSIYGLEITPGISFLRLNSTIDQQPITNFQSKQDLTFNRQNSHEASANRQLRYRRQSSTISNRAYKPSYTSSLSQIAPGRGQQPPAPKRWFEASRETINLGSSMNLFNEKQHGEEKKVMIKEPSKYSAAFPAGSVVVTEEANKIIERSQSVPQKSALKRSSSFASQENNKSVKQVNKRTVSYQLKKFGRFMVVMFDLNLLRDPIYLNMMLGMSIAIFAEINFSLLMPFILNDMHYSTEQIASVCSALGITDVIFRFLAPYLGELLRQPPRMMYMFSLLLLIITRSTIFLANDYTTMLIVGFLLGIGKGVRTVYMSLVIPDYIPIERLAAASGIQMITNGIILMGAGPILGWIRDFTGSYSACIVIMNMITFTTFAMWSVELLYFKYFKNK